MTELKSNKVYQAICYIQNLIKDTPWDGHIFAVGGCVRDISLGEEPKDLDIVVDKEHGGVAFATWITNRTQCHVTGSNPVIFPKYGTAKFNFRNSDELKDLDIECVATRKEQYHSDSRNPKVEFGTIEEDAKRRDLTINALYLNISNGDILDFNGYGAEDLEKHIIRTPDDADIIFSDDPLRQLRVIRFATRYGWGIEKNTWLGVVKNAYRMEIISQERITDELNKILVCKTPSKGIRALYHSGLLKMVLPEVYDLIGMNQGKEHFGDVFEHTMAVLDNTQPILENRLAALFHDIGKLRCRSYGMNGDCHFYGHEDVGATMVEDIMRRMKYPNATINAVKCAVKNHMKFKHAAVPSSRSIRKLVANVGEHLELVLDVINADNNSHAKAYCMPYQIKDIRKRIEELKKKEEAPSKIVLPINGHDVMEALNLHKSPKVGRYLNAIKEAYMDNPKITKEECLEMLKTVTIED